MKKYLVLAGLAAAMVLGAHPAQAAISSVDIYGNALRDGDLVSARVSAGDPDIFIIKFGPADNRPGSTEGIFGYKRLFLNPAIFRMYGHLGGFERVRQVSSEVRDAFTTSGLFRNCETDDRRVWAVEVTAEDDAILHHVEMSAEQAGAEDSRFFHRVFCINSREDQFYPKSIYPYRRLADIPPYRRQTCQERPACLDSEPRCLMPEPAEGWCPQPTPVCIREGGDVPATSGNMCCSGLTAVQRRDMNGSSYGSSSWKCARAGCYYQDVQCVQAPCDPVLVCPSPSPTPTGGPCYVGGCSSQLCTDQRDMVSTCEWRNEYYCYQRYGRCARQTNGQCGWTSTTELNNCRAYPPTQ